MIPGVFFHPVQTPTHSPYPLALPEGVAPRRRQACQTCAHSPIMMGPLGRRAGKPAPCLKGDRTAAALRAASTVFVGYRTELAVLAGRTQLPACASLASSIPSKPPPTPPYPLALPEGADRFRQAYRYLQQETLFATLRETPAASSYQPAFRSNRWGAAKLAAPRFAPPNLSATAQNSG